MEEKMKKTDAKKDKGVIIGVVNKEILDLFNTARKLRLEARAMLVTAKTMEEDAEKELKGKIKRRRGFGYSVNYETGEILETEAKKDKDSKPAAE